jgi:hypothetical protein
MVSKRKLAVRLAIFALSLSGRGWSQDPVQQPAPQPTQQPAQEPAQQPVADKPTAEATTVADSGQQAADAAQPAPVAGAATHTQWTKKSKTPYTGPTQVIELTPTPMLDEEGKQRLDPDGKPMFNPPVKQQRDKYGHPLFDEHGKPVFQTATELGYDDGGKKLHVKKEKPPKTTSITIAKGTLTVDGLIGKAALNYDIKDFHYVYLYAPWIGTVVVSNVPFPGSRMQANGFDQHTLTVNVEDHQFQVFSEKVLLGKKPAPAYVAVNRDFKLPSKVPVMGYGTVLKAPYQWPGAKENPESKAYVKPPPVPVSLRPVALLPPCPQGQMRPTSRVVLPGEDVPPAPCVPIAAAKPASVAATAAPAPAAAPAVTESPSASASATPPPSQQ